MTSSGAGESGNLPEPVPLFGFEGDGGLQETTLAIYTVLCGLRRDWGGALIVARGLGSMGSAIALAANVAGAACLSIEADPSACRAAMRLGACDFLVNTVDESLRVLKNEIRQHRPLSVALELDVPAALGELLERGVLPQLFTSARGEREDAVTAAAAVWAGQGSRVVDFGGQLREVEEAPAAGERLRGAMADQGRTPHTFSFANSAALRQFDAVLGQETALTNTEVRKWMAASSRLFYRDRPLRRTLLLTDSEASAVRSAAF